MRVQRGTRHSFLDRRSSGGSSTTYAFDDTNPIFYTSHAAAGGTRIIVMKIRTGQAFSVEDLHGSVLVPRRAGIRCDR
jgi:hypothetical protein